MQKSAANVCVPTNAAASGFHSKFMFSKQSSSSSNFKFKFLSSYQFAWQTAPNVLMRSSACIHICIINGPRHWRVAGSALYRNFKAGACLKNLRTVEILQLLEHRKRLSVVREPLKAFSAVSLDSKLLILNFGFKSLDSKLLKTF